MYKYDISASAVIQDFNRRGISPDWVKEVHQGVLRLWRINNNLIAELYIGSDNGKSVPGTIIITGGSIYVNTLSPQVIADDLMAENKLNKAEIEIISLMSNQGDAWLTTVEIEEKYGLAKSSVRRDIHREKFTQEELKKVGRDWLVKAEGAERLYSKKVSK